MKTEIELSLNPSHENFTELMQELNEVVDTLINNSKIENAMKYLNMKKFNFIKYGRGGSHIWVKFSYNDTLSERVLFATERK